MRLISFRYMESTFSSQKELSLMQVFFLVWFNASIITKPAYKSLRCDALATLSLETTNKLRLLWPAILFHLSLV